MELLSWFTGRLFVFLRGYGFKSVVFLFFVYYDYGLSEGFVGLVMENRIDLNEDFFMEWSDEGDILINDNGFEIVFNPTEDLDFTPDLVLVSEENYYNKKVLESICGDRTCLVLFEEKSDAPCNDVEVVNSSEILEVFNIRIKTFEQENGFSYLIGLFDYSFFVATDLNVQINNNLSNEKIDFAFLPLKSLEEKSEMVKLGIQLKPGNTIPYMFGTDMARPDIENLKAELVDRNLRKEIDL